VAREITDELLRDFAVECMTRPEGYGTDDRDLFATWGLTPIGMHRDSGPLEVSNFERIREVLEGEFPDDVGTERDSHFGHGWHETLVIRVMRPRPAPAPRLYGAALEKWEDSWVFSRAQASELKGAALRRWLETRVTLALRRLAEICAQLEAYAVFDSGDLSARELEEAREKFTETWAEMRGSWDDEPELDGEPNDGYDGPAPPPQEPGKDDPDFGFAWDAFFDSWQDDSGSSWMPASELKELIKDSEEYSAYCDQLRQLPGQGALLPRHPQEPGQ